MCLENIDEFAFQSKIQPVIWNYLTMRHICFKMENVEVLHFEVEYHPRAILYAFACVRVSWSCVWSCTCGVRCLLSARLQNELGKLMQLLIYLWDLYHRQWCVSWVFLSVLLVELGMTWCEETGFDLSIKPKKFLKHLNISLFCQSFMCKSFKRRSIIPGERYPIAFPFISMAVGRLKCMQFWVCDVLISVVTYLKFV